MIDTLLQLLLCPLVLVERDLELGDELLKHLGQLGLLAVLALQSFDCLLLLSHRQFQLLLAAGSLCPARLVNGSVRALVQVPHQALQARDLLKNAELLRRLGPLVADAVDRTRSEGHGFEALL